MPRLLLASIIILGSFFATACSSPAAESTSRSSLAVAAVQMRSTRDLPTNLTRIKKSLSQSAHNGARLVVFPECALTGYYDDVVANVSADLVTRALGEIAGACAENNVYAVVGTPFVDGTNLYNSAVVIAPTGRIVTRYDKIQLAEGWPRSGTNLVIFKADGVPCSIIICHDERYPELVRLPVLAGARVIIYVSHESGLREERKLDPYRAQIQARAVENTVFIVHANAPANSDLTGSHGQSRIIAPDGNIIKEASMFEEETVAATLDLKKASGANARNSLSRGPLRDWWQAGISRVRIVKE